MKKKYVCEKYLATSMQGAFEEYKGPHKPDESCKVVSVAILNEKTIKEAATLLESTIRESYCDLARMAAKDVLRLMCCEFCVNHDTICTGEECNGFKGDICT